MLPQAVRSCAWCPLRPLLRPLPVRLYHDQVRPPHYEEVRRQHRRRHGAPPESRESPSMNTHASRRALAENVAESPSPSPWPSRRRAAQDPFGSLNQTRVPASLIRAAEKARAREDTTPRARGSHQRTSAAPSRGHKARRRGKAERGERDPFHALRMQQALDQIPYAERIAIKRRVEMTTSFADFGLLDSVLQALDDALPGLEYRTPTPAQAITIPTLTGFKKRISPKAVPTTPGLETFLLAAETGSGKTLAYLLPIVDAIKRAEAQEKEQAEQQARAAAQEAATLAHAGRDHVFGVQQPQLNKAVDPARPRAIILVPSAELVAQVGKVAKSLSHAIKFRAAILSAKRTTTVIRNQLFQENGVDLVICTPPLLASIVKTAPNILARVTHLVCDEADSLLDDSFEPFTTQIIARATPSLQKMLFCSATIPRYLNKYLGQHYPGMRRLVTPNLHAIPRRVQLGVVDVNKDPYRGNKNLACADVIWQIGRATSDYDDAGSKERAQTKRVLVFVNEREHADQVAAYLVSKGIDAVAFHRDTEPSRQTKILDSFTGSSIPDEHDNASPSLAPPPSQPTSPTTSSPPKSKQHQQPQQQHPKRTLPNTKVLVTTDLASRGIDTVSVRHVVLYDVPHTTIDFIHRLGRTGRMGRRGRGVVLLGPGDRADVVKEVREAMFMGKALI